MHLRRFFIVGEINLRDTISLKDEERNHIVKVLRLKVGDEISIFNGNGKEYKALIKSIQPREVFCEIVEEIKRDTEAKLKIFLAFSIPKSDKIDFIIQKCTELGVHSLIPFQSEYTVVDYTGKDVDKKLKRLRMIAINACKQSLRNLIPEIIYMNNFQSCVEYLKNKKLKIILYESEKEAKIKDVLNEFHNPNDVAIIVGTEGGFTETEIEYATESGFKSVTLGKRILRAETAAITVSSIIMYHYNELE